MSHPGSARTDSSYVEDAPAAGAGAGDADESGSEAPPSSRRAPSGRPPAAAMVLGKLGAGAASGSSGKRGGASLWAKARVKASVVGRVQEESKAARFRVGAKKMWQSAKRRLAQAADEFLEGESTGSRLTGVLRGLTATADTAVDYEPPKHVGPYTPMTHEERMQRWFEVWWAAARPPRKRQFAATVIQHAYADYLLRVAALERRCARLISEAYIRYLARRNTRAYWHNFDVSRIDRDTLEFILRRLNRPVGGQRARIERDFKEYLLELPLMYETKRFAHKKHRLAEMGKAGAVYTFGANHMGQLGVGDKVPCSYEPILVRGLAGMGVRVVSASPEGQTAFAVSSTGAVYSWGGGGTGPQGLDFELGSSVPRRGNAWYTKPVRVDRQSHDEEDKVFVDWSLRCNSSTTKTEREQEKIRREVLRGRTSYAPDMMEMTQAFEGLRRGERPPRHFPEWRPRVSNASSRTATTATRTTRLSNATTATRATTRTRFSRASSSGLPPRDTKLLDVKRRGSTMSAVFQSTRRNVFGFDGEVWLGVGLLQSNCVWVAAGQSHAVASLYEGGALHWGDARSGVLGGVEIPKEDPTLFDQPQWVQALSQDFVAHVGASRFHNCVVTSNGELLCWGKPEHFEGAERAAATHYLAVDDVPLYRWPSLRAVRMHQVYCGPTFAAAISDVGHLYTWGNGEGGKLGHGDTKPVNSPRLVKALASQVVLSAACGVQHMAAVVEVPGVTAYVGRANQPYADEDEPGRWGNVVVPPIHPNALSFRRLSKVSRATRTSRRSTARASTLRRTRLSDATSVSGYGFPQSSRTVMPRVRPRSGKVAAAAAEAHLKRTMSSGALVEGNPVTRRPTTPGTPAGVPGGTATFLRSRKAPSLYRRFDSDVRPGGPAGIGETDDVDLLGTSSEGEEGQLGGETGTIGGGNMEEKASRPPSSHASRPPSSHASRRQRRKSRTGKAARGTRRRLLEQRGLPALNNRVAPGTPAGALYTWGTGTYGQLGQKLEVSAWLPRPVEWGPRTMLGSGLTVAQMRVLGLSFDDKGNLLPPAKAPKPVDPDKDPTKQHVDISESQGVRTKRVTVDFKGLPSAVAREAGIGCPTDGDGVPVDRYRAEGMEDEIPGWLRTRNQRQRLVEYIARKWMLDELVYRNRREFGVWQATDLPRPLVMVQAVSCGARHTAAISSKGEVYTFGCDHKGTLGRPVLGPILHDATVPRPLDTAEAAALLKAKKADLQAGTALAAMKARMGVSEGPTTGVAPSSTHPGPPAAGSSVAVMGSDPWTAAAEKAKTGPFARDVDADEDGMGGKEKASLSLYEQEAPPNLRVMPTADIALFAGVNPRLVPVNPFDALPEIPEKLLRWWLRPKPLPGETQEADEDTLMFRHKKLQGGRMGDLALRKRSKANLDERQRMGERPPPRTMSTLPRTTSAHPMPFREHSYYKQGVGARLLPGKRHTDWDGKVQEPPTRLRRKKKFNVEAVDDVLTSALTLTHDGPHPDSFSRPGMQPYLQRDLQMHVSNRSLMFMDPRRRIGSPELLAVMRNWYREETQEEVKSPLQRMYEAQMAGGSPADVSPLRKDTPYNFSPGFIGREKEERDWHGGNTLKDIMGVHQPLADKLHQDPGLVLGPVLVAARVNDDGGVEPVQEPLPTEPPRVYMGSGEVSVGGSRVRGGVSQSMRMLPPPMSPLRSTSALAPSKEAVPTPTPDDRVPQPSQPPRSVRFAPANVVPKLTQPLVGDDRVKPFHSAAPRAQRCGGGGGLAGAFAGGSFLGGVRPAVLPSMPPGSPSGAGDRAPSPPATIPDARTQTQPSANFNMVAATDPVAASRTMSTQLVPLDHPTLGMAASHGVAPLPQPQFSVHGTILPAPARPLFYTGIREQLYQEPPPPPKRRTVRDPDLFAGTYWDQRYVDGLNADPAKYAYPDGFYDRLMRKRAAETGGELWLSGKKDIFSSFDARAVAARMGVDWHGIEEYVPGQRWNQWEAGEGTGGGRVRPYSTEEFMAKLNRDDEDRSSEEEEEKEEEKKTVAEKRQDRQGRPGFMPAPMVETWRWSSTPGRVVGVVDAGRSCSVACGYDFTAVATLSRGYYDIVDEDFDTGSSGWSAVDDTESGEEGEGEEAAPGPRRRPPGAPPASARLTGRTEVSGSLTVKRKPRPAPPAGPRPVPKLPLAGGGQVGGGQGDDGGKPSPLATETRRTAATFHSRYTTAEAKSARAAAAADDDGDSSGPDDATMLGWLRGVCRVCEKCLGFEPGGTNMFFCARCHHHKWLHGKRPPVTEEIQALFAIKIQRIFRANRAKAKFRELVKGVIEKVRDPETGMYYYYNRRSGESTWEKPALLGDKDVDETFYSRRLNEDGEVTWVSDAEAAALAAAEAGGEAGGEGAKQGEGGEPGLPDIDEGALGDGEEDDESDGVDLDSHRD